MGYSLTKRAFAATLTSQPRISLARPLKQGRTRRATFFPNIRHTDPHPSSAARASGFFERSPEL